ncbi:MAG: D-2-hydroxyacid dehydrogenase [Deltaproteobacteria bacterium]|nr:D-2-hydroxyacid dehydrogenase [Deltaproteobacteria bacterium]MBT4266761.1 D-2-hydroxyacid dehydrogenase [Deltaproteobacteria bacterium]MBT4643725.1 D-2-hydroxyacid dehydrogenase [Deltaproteobacteria bacterium]MBT6503289.1 D-2-hydroxyacid dehydrogenase [Deltaproteobacteria bacterium]MBT7151969.1 D-2-hydroxyacid dehydrogenase [Deltaproteobacteria bacterium]
MTRKKINGIAVFYGLMLREDTFLERHLKRIQEYAPGAEVVVIKSREEWTEAMTARSPKFEIFLGLFLNAWIAKLPNLKWAQLASAGADRVLKSPEIAQSDVILTNASGVHAIPISEHILALIFAFSRNLNNHMMSQFEGKWKRRSDITELEGTTLGLIGVGKIGEKTAEKAKALNMKVVGVRRNPERSSPFVDRMFGPDRLHEMLAMSDWVVVTAAGTSETDGLIGEAELEAMKETAVIINIARGSLIQEEFLIRALLEDKIAGAGLDVFETEPLPEESPLWEMPNVVITPHVAGGTPHYIDRLLDIFTENLKRYQAGEPLINMVDKVLGY